MVFCDNAGTFQLGAKIINEDITQYKNSWKTNGLEDGAVAPPPAISNMMVDEHVDVKFITPLSPWQGGVYERLVGIAKNQLFKEIGRARLEWFHLYHAVKRVEGLMNSRPIMPNPTRAHDMLAPRPIDFLVPSVLVEISTDFQRSVCQLIPLEVTHETESRDASNGLQG
uniref:Integrase catalytic domain-containing protein n=1 Tax=Caenorhabditis japonica TaxID=281687 RepID=A0A8R1EK15_CAEJA